MKPCRETVCISGKWEFSSWGAHLHQGSRSILQRCAKPLPHPGNALITPKAALPQGCPLQQEAKSSANQAQAVISGYLHPNLLRMLLNDVGSNATSSTKTTYVWRGYTALWRVAKSRMSSWLPANIVSLSHQVPVCVRGLWASSSCGDATLSCQVFSDPQRCYVLPEKISCVCL